MRTPASVLLLALLVSGCGPSAEGEWADTPPAATASEAGIRFTLVEGRRGRLTGRGVLQGRQLEITGRRSRTSVLLDMAVQNADSAAFQGGLVGRAELYGYFSTRGRGEALRLFRQ